ncbi:Peptide/nickel transport system permease protein [Candidatus Electronema halotolerans]
MTTRHAAILFLKRLARMGGILIGVSLLTFVLLELVPGDAADLLLSSQMQTASPAQAAALRQELALDAPLPLRYLRWLGRAAVLDFGTSIRSGEPVSREILRCLPVTMTLALLTFSFAVTVSVLGGIIAALFEKRLPDRGHRLFAILAVSIPDYWLGLMLLLLFALKLGWLPVLGGSGPEAFILPVLALGLSAAAAEGRVFRASIIATLQQDWVLFARAKGLHPAKVWLRHVLRPAALPMLSVWGMQLGHLLGGAVVIESVFSLPGLGKLAADAVLQRDLPMIQGAVLAMTCFFILASGAMESIHALLAPKNRLAMADMP